MKHVIFVVILALLVLFVPISAFTSTRVSLKARTGVTKQSPRLNLPVLAERVVDCSGSACVFEDEITGQWTIVDFYADWCGPCKLAAKTFQSVAEEFSDKNVKFVKVDTEVHEDSVDLYGLKGLPVFGIFKDGKLIKKHEGNLGKQKLLEFIEQGISENA